MASDVVLVRHGQTAWSRDRRHTGLTDLPLLEEGKNAATALRPALSRWNFSHVVTSPLTRASATARLALPDFDAEIDHDLVEWDYGDYEGVTTADIRKTNPTWDLWTEGAPGGESPAEVSARVDRALARIDSRDGNVGVFAHGHILRALAARWVELDVSFGGVLRLATATVSVLGREHGRRAIDRWNAPQQE